MTTEIKTTEKRLMVCLREWQSQYQKKMLSARTELTLQRAELGHRVTGRAWVAAGNGDVMTAIAEIENWLPATEATPILAAMARICARGGA